MNDIKFDEFQEIGTIKNGKFEIKNEQIKKKHIKGEKIPGVWALFGKTKPEKIELEGYYPWDKTTNSEMWCLQVGQSQDIIGEITTDSELFAKPIPQEYEYINQFGEHIFSYIGIKATGRSLGNLYSYYFLSEYFTDFKFILLQEEQDKNLRKKIESMFAIGTRALCWRNGGRIKKDGGINSDVIYDEMIELSSKRKLHKNFECIPNDVYFSLIEFIKKYHRRSNPSFKRQSSPPTIE